MVRPHVVKSRVLIALLALLALTLTGCGGGDDSATSATDLCAPPGVGSASAAPTNLDAAAATSTEDRYTTPTTKPLDQIDTGALGLATPGKLSVGTLSDAPPSICVDSSGSFTGYDNELLKAVAAKLGLQIEFSGTEFAGLLSQVATNRFDVGSSSITTTDERRKTVGFTNGYDFGYFSLVVPNGSAIHGFSDLNAGTRIGVVQGTVQDDYVVNTLGLDPVKFPDYNTAYANLKTGQIDAWVAPSQQAEGAIKPGDPTSIVQNTFSLNNFVGWAVNKDNQPLIDALNSGLDAVIADGTWASLYSDWVPRELPEGWKPGSKAAPEPELPDFAALAKPETPGSEQSQTAQQSTLAQLGATFFDWDLYRQAIPDLLKTGLPNTVILAVTSGVIGTVAGMLLAVAGISRTRWLRWPARVYTDVFRGLPAVVIILIIGLGVGPVVKGLTGNNPYWLGAAALALLAAAYIGEIFRSGIQSVEPGQLEAARAIGFSYRRAMTLVVIPQGVRRVLPALMNQFISLIKDSSLIYFLGLLATQRELFAVGRDLNAQTGNLSPLVAAGLFYLALTIPLTHLVNYIDRRLRTGRADTSGTLDPLEQAIVVERG
ncbi:amino acid ABC transporter substrate-binding protein (PAAT family) /amino acid ABC transporter membrane protein (PAAT family) [Rhodococcus sp. OK611]|uniref:ABC transporter substrate-binding protein/permease n=1 Tax=unclassified Rhodococcus (in: high G+C Gram-positive bacteria) TaxID=192944 RepID=UPI000BD5FF8D|nr:MULTISPECIES: ABC transporter substrate-binding protein/permease [unclassified Rhodococcus (in: high G+C Gram-positive bacteria)]PTR44688.1 amino acid ABC transporter substrate-binding protein (PAAT family) /amino acid ABC transporter membrane protein (PAAT family) [Rhodococcus sp. OK611]SNX90129.1 amino acid ABC transporter substrate-binding protein, PAAT family /amino acid ABC transporter membrane protein, PAAT family [Rhodococcus sp. OK270]